jgi:NAD-dependent deacetylase
MWKNHQPEELATPGAFVRDPALVWEFYNWRREKIARSKPNTGHTALADMEKVFEEFYIITQNVDGLHQKAGSKKVIELHGDIWYVRCTEACSKRRELFPMYDVPLKEIPPVCPDCGAHLRPHVVWFGETLPEAPLAAALELSENCDFFLVVGTSALVQPAASLPRYALRSKIFTVEINPEPTPLSEIVDEYIQAPSGVALPLLLEEIQKYL